MTRYPVVLLIALTLLVAGIVLASEPRSVQSGVFTKEQAERGAKLFEDVCQRCHKPADFIDAGYMDSWSGQMLADFLDQIRTTMPQDTPGSLKRSEYVDVVAHILALNGTPTGDDEMDSESVKEIRIEGPFGAQQLEH